MSVVVYHCSLACCHSNLLAFESGCSSAFDGFPSPVQEAMSDVLNSSSLAISYWNWWAVASSKKSAFAECCYLGVATCFRKNSTDGCSNSKQDGCWKSWTEYGLRNLKFANWNLPSDSMMSQRNVNLTSYSNESCCSVKRSDWKWNGCCQNFFQGILQTKDSRVRGTEWRLQTGF